MPKTATATSYQATVPLPGVVRTYFQTLLSFGAVAFTPGDRQVTVRFTIPDDYDLGVTVVQLQQALGAAELTPAFPRPGRLGFGVTADSHNAYRWLIERPTPIEPGVYVTQVQATADVLHFFDTLTGLAAVEFTPGTPGLGRRGEPNPTVAETATVIFDQTDTYDLAQTISEIEQELTAWFADPVTFSRPVARVPE